MFRAAVKDNCLRLTVDKATGVPDRDGGFSFVPRQHPYFDIWSFQVLDCFFDLILEFVFDRSGCYYLEVFFYFRLHIFNNLFSFGTNYSQSIDVLLVPALIVLRTDLLLSKHKGSEALLGISHESLLNFD